MSERAAANDAPVWMSNLEAMAWATGYNKGWEDCSDSQSETDAGEDS